VVPLEDGRGRPQTLRAGLTAICLRLRKAGRALGVAAVCLFAAFSLSGREKDAVDYGAGLIINLPFPESEVVQVVQDVVQNGIIRGTKEYNKDEYISGAAPQSAARVFPAWTDEGKVFYKVREHALDPRNFKDSGDVGTLAVRYIVAAQGEKNTVLRINAVFVEDFRHTVHQSNGSVESAEYKDIHDRLDAIAVMQQQTAEAQRERSERLAGKTYSSSVSAATGQPQASVPVEDLRDSASASASSEPPASELNAAPGAAQTLAAQSLQERARDLRRQVERLVKSPGAALKSAPFHTASTLQSLPAGSEVLIVITTPYWLGIETHDGQHGWIPRDDLEPLP